jgi:hypothetical protein
MVKKGFISGGKKINFLSKFLETRSVNYKGFIAGGEKMKFLSKFLERRLINYKGLMAHNQMNH